MSTQLVQGMLLFLVLTVNSAQVRILRTCSYRATCSYSSCPFLCALGICIHTNITHVHNSANLHNLRTTKKLQAISGHYTYALSPWNPTSVITGWKNSFLCPEMLTQSCIVRLTNMYTHTDTTQECHIWARMTTPKVTTMLLQQQCFTSVRKLPNHQPTCFCLCMKVYCWQWILPKLLIKLLAT